MALSTVFHSINSPDNSSLSHSVLPVLVLLYWSLQLYISLLSKGGDVAQLLKHRTVTPLTKVRFPGAARDFFPGVNFQCRLSYVCPYTRVIACIYICAHVKDPVVHVRVRWIMQTLKHPTCTVGWVPQLCRSWLSLGKATRI